jgi:hypothetical protein
VTQDLQVLQRFLVGAATDAEAVRGVLARRSDAMARPVARAPSDAASALIDSVARFFTVLGDAYEALRPVLAAGDRDDVEQVVASWQPRLDNAAAAINQRVRALTSPPPPTIPLPAPRRVPDRSWLALLFIILALLGAGAVLWAVQRGWPMTPVDLPF